MTSFTIHSEADYQRALDLVRALWNAEPGTRDAAVLEVMAGRLEAFEASELDSILPPANPRVVIAAKLRELNMSQRALGKALGWSTGRVSEVLSGRRALTLAMVRALAPALGIDARLLVEDCVLEENAPVSVRVPKSLVRQAVAAGYCGHRSLDELVACALSDALTVASAWTMAAPVKDRGTGVPDPRLYGATTLRLAA